MADQTRFSKAAGHRTVSTQAFGTVHTVCDSLDANGQPERSPKLHKVELLAQAASVKAQPCHLYKQCMRSGNC